MCVCVSVLRNGRSFVGRHRGGLDSNRSTSLRLVCANWIDFFSLRRRLSGQSIISFSCTREQSAIILTWHKLIHSFTLFLSFVYDQVCCTIEALEFVLASAILPILHHHHHHHHPWSSTAQDSDSALIDRGLSSLRLRVACPPSYPSAGTSPSAQKAKVRAHLEPAYLQSARFCPVLLQICKESPSPGRTPSPLLDCSTRARPPTHPGAVEGDD